MRLFDTHAHLDTFIADNTLAQVLDDAKTAGLEHIITASTKPEDWLKYRKLAQNSDGLVLWTIGIHPEDIDENSYDFLDALPSFFADDIPPAAVGEIGLDFHFLPKEKSAAAETVKRQKEIFARQLALARDLGAKVCIHARDALDEVVDGMLSADFPPENAVFHCYSGNVEQLKRLNALGARASWTGIITYPSADEMRRCMLAQGLEKIMFETDCPYLAPVPHRKETNRPALVSETVKYAANLFNIPAETLADISTSNATNWVLS